MKKIFLTLAIGIASYSTYAQSVFPTDGSNVGVGTTSPSSYFHGGNNKVIEVSNPNISANSQSHLILSTGSTLDGSSAGTLTWISKNSSGFQGMAFIGSAFQGDGTTNAASKMIFATSNGTSIYERMTIDKDGNVSIGTANPNGYKLAVQGNVHAQQVTIDITNWPDYVFRPTYKLPSLIEVKSYIDKNHHLSGMPSAEDVFKNGLNLGETNRLLTKKVEELTLYLIEKDQQIKEIKETQQSENQKLQEQLKVMQDQLNKLVNQKTKS